MTLYDLFVRSEFELAIQLNRLHLSTVFYVKLVLGGISVIGIIPLFSADVELVLYSYC